MSGVTRFRSLGEVPLRERRKFQYVRQKVALSSYFASDAIPIEESMISFCIRSSTLHRATRRNSVRVSKRHPFRRHEIETRRRTQSTFRIERLYFPIAKVIRIDEHNITSSIRIR
ncbi:hypothetical protein [Aporhodopirellula aestuarii]|uniref:Ribosomal protein S10 n=1 Tax=Aporhodopirellula aestuarii TaxID=2950107 RepID=A0ABT0U7R1_9BACT|nr:hypothetical protein [Aporhodopirellula aestuarii]MCM2372842.1 hypothetical protein [Aporhodopirellula aestuarii]